MRSPAIAACLVFAALACEDTLLRPPAAAVEIEDVAGRYVLRSVNDRTPPVAGFEGCRDLVERSVSLCAFDTARLHLTVNNTFRLALVEGGSPVALTVIKGAYGVAGRSMTYTSTPDGEFRGRVLLDQCEGVAGYGVTFERGPVVMRFCRDPEAGT